MHDRCAAASPGALAAPVAALAAPLPHAVHIPDEAAIGVALAALLAGIVVGGRRSLRRHWPAAAADPHAAADRPPSPVRVIGYLTSPRHDDREAVAAVCDHHGWQLDRLVREPAPALPGLVNRPHLMYALEELRVGGADGIVIGRLGELATDFDDLATVVRWVQGAGRFLAAADHPLNTATEPGAQTAQAIVGLGNWQRHRAIGRFAPSPEPTREGLGPAIDALRSRGLPDRAIADALELAGVPAPAGHRRWQAAAVQTLAGRHDHDRGDL